MSSKDIDKILAFAYLFGIAIVWLVFPWGWKELTIKITLTLCICCMKEK